MPRRLRVVLGGLVIAETTDGLRVLETSHPPVYYFPPGDVRRECLRPARGTSWCEWKGEAHYHDVAAGGRTVPRGAWSYPRPLQGFERLRDHVAFYAGPMDACFVGEERARPQPGGFYGGWITAGIEGPFKGSPGTAGW